MNGKQRIQTALNREQPDVVPIWEMAFNEESIIGIGKYFVDDDKLPPKKKTVDMTAEEKAAMMYTYVTFVNELDLDGVTALSTAPRVRIDKDYILAELNRSTSFRESFINKCIEACNELRRIGQNELRRIGQSESELPRALRES